MNLLLDTQVLLWCLADPGHLRREARDRLVDPASVVYASAVSGWEIAIKRALGKLDAPDDLEQQLVNRRFVELPLHLRHAGALAGLPPIHRDPFDRMLVAQAKADGLTLVTRDRQIAKYPIATLLA